MEINSLPQKNSVFHRFHFYKHPNTGSMSGSPVRVWIGMMWLCLFLTLVFLHRISQITLIYDFWLWLWKCFEYSKRWRQGGKTACPTPPLPEHDSEINTAHESLICFVDRRLWNPHPTGKKTFWVPAQLYPAIAWSMQIRLSVNTV
jgi:hypothetical protein